MLIEQALDKVGELAVGQVTRRVDDISVRYGARLYYAHWDLVQARALGMVHARKNSSGFFQDVRHVAYTGPHTASTEHAILQWCLVPKHVTVLMANLHDTGAPITSEYQPTS